MKYITIFFMLFYLFSCGEDPVNIKTKTEYIGDTDYFGSVSKIRITAGQEFFWKSKNLEPEAQIILDFAGKREYKLDNINYDRYQIMEELLDEQGKVLAKGISGVIDINKPEDLYPVYIMPVNKFVKFDNTKIGVSNSLTMLKGHTVTELPDGKLLIWGGMNGSFYNTDVYIYDTGKQAAITISTNIPRAFHTAVLYYLDAEKKHPRVLITGGMNGNGYLKTAEVFNPEDNTIKELPVQDLSEGVNQAAIYSNGFIYIFGGKKESGYSNEIIFFNPITEQYTMHDKKLGVSVENLTATYISEGKIIIAGGNDANNVYGKVFFFDSSANDISEIGVLTNPRTKHNAFLYNGGVVFIGGFSGHSGDEFSGAVRNIEYAEFSGITTMGSLKEGRGEAAVSFINGNTVIVTGGYKSSANVEPIKAAEIIRFGLKSATSFKTIEMNTPKNGSVSVLTSTGVVLIIGGYSINLPNNILDAVVIELDEDETN